MKKLLIACLSGLSVIPAVAETFNIRVGSVVYSAPVDACGEMIYSHGSTLTVLGKDYALADVTGMTVDDCPVEAGKVVITYADDAATVAVDASIARFLDITVSEAKVDIVQHDDVSATNGGEITYVLRGRSEEGSFSMSGAYKATVVLDGVELSSTSDAPVDIQNGKRIKLMLADGTMNRLADGASGSQKGCVVCKGHLEIHGSGSLEVIGNKAHGIYSKEYVTLQDASVSVTSAVKDGLNCNQYFEMQSGELTISGVGDDGIQVSFKDDVDRADEDTGSIIIVGGKIDVSVTAIAAKAIKADGDIFVSGGEVDARVSGDGKWDSDALKTKASTCMSADGQMVISGGILTLLATGSGGKGISVDGDLNIAGGTVTVTTSGGLFAYVNGKEYTNYTGNTDHLDSDYKSSPKGIKADGNVTIDGGYITVTTTGIGAEGIESKAIMTVNDGKLDIRSYDDGLNSSSHMYLKGGDITVVATNNDAIDSNGNMYIEGGVIRACGASAPECGIDANEEEGYSVYFTGGVLIAIGGGNSTPSSSSSTQPYVSGSLSVTSGGVVTLYDGSDAVVSFDIPENYNPSAGGGFGGNFMPGGGPGGGGPGFGGNMGQSVLITCPGLISGSSYTLNSGNTSSSVKAQLTGNSGGFPR